MEGLSTRIKAWRGGDRRESIGWDAGMRGTQRESGRRGGGRYEDIGGVQRGCRMEGSKLGELVSCMK